MRLLVTGAGGMLASDVCRAAQRAGHEPLALDRAALDIVDATAIERALQASAPEMLLNCAAFSLVDVAESDREGAFAVNARGAGNLARAAAAAAVPLLHVSSDYVFDGVAPLDAYGAPRAYLERDPTSPLSAYGESKLAGEREVLAASPMHAVVRSSWLFGLNGENFAASMLRLARERGEVAVVEDQIGSPTWTGHLAPALIGVLERGLRGLVHLAGGGHVSWNGFAREIFRQAELDCRVLGATSAQMARRARRPAWSPLESERDDVLPLPPWQDGLAGYLAARAGMMTP